MLARIARAACLILVLSPPLFAQSLTIDDVVQGEGNGGQTIYTFTVTLSPAGAAVTVDWSTMDDTATSGSDYVADSGILTFGPGAGSMQIQVLVNGDTVLEPDELFVVKLTNPSGATIGDDTGIGKIENDDVGITINPDTSHPEGNSGFTSYGFTVDLSGSYPLTVAVDWTTSDGTALSGSDYVADSGTLTFNPGDTSLPITVQSIGDTAFEMDEVFHVVLSNPVNATITDGIVDATILNDDVSYTLSMSADVSHPEGDSGLTNYDFTVTLSPASPQIVSVNWATLNGTAFSGSDYVAASGTLTFMPGETAKPITVQGIGDTAVEPTEHFFVQLTSVLNATITDGSATAYLLNDDIGVSIGADTSHNEGNTGTTSYGFTVNLSGPSALTVSVHWSTADGTALLSDNDYVFASGTLIFLPGEVSKPVTVQAVGDTKLEINETFFVVLSAPMNASITDGSVTATIVNDDTVSSIGIINYSLTEGNGLTPFSFQVDLSGPSADIVSVSFATSDGTAEAGSDYTAVSDVLTFDPGETSKSISVEVRGDDVHESDETFFVILSNPVNATISMGTATGTIENDDALDLTIDDVSLMEGDSGTTAFSFTLSLSNPSQLSSSVGYKVTPVSASAGIDYVPATGTVTFSPGTTALPLQVDVVGEKDHEIDETFTVDLLSPSVLTILDDKGLGTILDDDMECSPGAAPVVDLRIAVTGGGADLRFSWTDTAGSVAYDLYESGSSMEPFGGPAGSSTSGSTGISMRMPAGDGFYLLTSTNPDCGEGPRHLCAHDLCDAGAPLDSGCDPCAATVCTADSSCCTSQWSASCAAQAATLCGIRCN